MMLCKRNAGDDMVLHQNGTETTPSYDSYVPCPPPPPQDTDAYSGSNLIAPRVVILLVDVLGGIGLHVGEGILLYGNVGEIVLPRHSSK